MISFNYENEFKIQDEEKISNWISTVISSEECKVDFELELQRVMVHGILHYCGYKDKTDNDIKLMRAKENHYLNLLK